VGDTFHEATIAQKYPRPVIDDLVARPVKLGREHFFRQGHAHCIGHTLAQRPGRCLYRPARLVFRVSGRPVAKLSEMLQLLDRKFFITTQIQQAIKQHRRVAIREYETIAIRPCRISGIVPQVAIPNDFGDIRHAHRGARMTGVGGLDRIHTQATDCIREIAPGRLSGARYCD